MAVVKVLLVDDVRLFLEFERTFFERTGCQILTATSGGEAVDLAVKERPQIILLDYELPDRKGDVVCRQLKADDRTKDIPVLIVTSFGSPDVRERCLAAGAADFVAKPIAGRALLERVINLLQIPFRAFLRLPISLEVVLEGAAVKRRVEGYSEDLSETGVLVDVSEYIPRGSRVRVALTLPGADRPVSLEGEVRRVFDKPIPGRFGVGVEFAALPRDIRRRIRTHVEEATR
ncbi:MAG: response regulator [Acidobacteriota bacterium]|jgi:uncharacterized protein (TIGR02266 family)